MSYRLPFTQSDLVLELGGGETGLKKQGFNAVNVDVRKLDGVDIVCDLESDFSHIGKYKFVYSQYIAEHICWRRVESFFRSIYNILEDGGVATFVIPNLKEQAKVLANKEEWTSTDICMVFGDQNYADNLHKCGYSPQYITMLLKQYGFSEVTCIPHPNCATDMIVEAKKLSKLTGYEKEYFNGVYTGTGYRDFPVNHNTVKKILEKNPKTVIELGGARGYVCKHLNYFKVDTLCVDVSEHCYHTRATENHVVLDTETKPLPVIDKAFDLCFSKAFLEHVHPENVDHVIRESMRVSRRGYHGITFSISSNDIDPTHIDGTIRDRDWWIAKFKEIDPSYEVDIVDKEDLEGGSVFIPVSDDGKRKINFGSFTEMFHYGWLNVDKIDLTDFAKAYGYNFNQHDVTTPIPIPDNNIHAIVAHHLIEHLTRAEGEAFLKECYRIMTPNATIRLSFPDVKLIASAYVNDDLAFVKSFSVIPDESPDDTTVFMRLITDNHKSAYTESDLAIILKRIGFVDVTLSKFYDSNDPTIRLETIDPFPTISGYVEAKKPVVGSIINNPTSTTDKTVLEYLNGA